MTSDDFSRAGFRDGLRALLIQMAPPYGFTLATFTAGGITAYYSGPPHPVEILVFLAGAFIGYAILALASGAIHRLLTPQGIRMQGWQMLHILPLATVFLVVWALVEVIPPPWCWLTSGMTLTIGYLSVLSLELVYLAHGTRNR